MFGQRTFEHMILSLSYNIIQWLMYACLSGRLGTLKLKPNHGSELSAELPFRCSIEYDVPTNNSSLIPALSLNSTN